MLHNRSKQCNADNNNINIWKPFQVIVQAGSIDGMRDATFFFLITQ